MTSLIGALHTNLVFNRRATVLARHLAALIPPDARVLDVGCGDGTVACLVQESRPDVAIEGIDVLVRTNARISVKPFDGSTIPHPGACFDVAMFVDVLHHTPDPSVLIREAVRVARTILIKDHFRDGFLSNTTLRFMDWFGNAHHGVALPYNYWSRRQWLQAFGALHVTPSELITSLGLYPVPASWLFERNLHFLARLESSPHQTRPPIDPRPPAPLY